ncbi:hypothetical protein DEU56DRAFT_827468 [Suillus clintonianus]|uniref:uncharacterized protein n=1 Tax=Suillus clintonianus TaxID=1904413 RepID=UPI001B85DDB6|nr:uncharacterized protein DEU56DRAFT_827468 [Suillus clintonianus]KAG2124454.1 hypothetical protein DEU56DRAFT_827468 [Suillus clintonianus]
MARPYSLSRREITLVLASVMIFMVFYNFEATFDFFANPNVPTIFSSSTADSSDLDMDIYGDWESDERHISSVHKQQEEKEDASDGDIWLKTDRISEAQKQVIFGNINVNDGFMHWGSDIPQTRLVKHVAGFSIMDNVIMCNGTIFIVTDSPLNFPSLDAIASSAESSYEAPLPREWEMLSTNQARDILGSYGGFIQGASWLSHDAIPNNYTLFSLWRTHSSMNTSTSPDPFNPPRRLFFPNIPTYKGIQPDLNGPIIRRHRSDSGFHPYLPKAAFPLLGLMYQEDWEDYALMEVPFVFERLVIADFGAAARSTNNEPPFALPLIGLNASKEWWEPIRQNLARFLRVNHNAQNPNSRQEKTVVTYISQQDARSGSRLRSADHLALVSALETLHESNDFEVHIVSSEGHWTERMSAVAQSTVILGVYGDSLADSVFMRPSGHSILMEFFPSDVFTRDAETAVRSLGIDYMAWWNDRRFESDSLPSVAPGSDVDHDVRVDPTAVVHAILEVASRT